MDDKLGFLGGDQPSEAEETHPASPEASQNQEPQADAPEPIASGPERGADGKFVSKAAEAPPEPDKAAASPLTEKETVGFYKAMQEERDKRQALERRLAELTAKAEPAAQPSRDEQLEAALYAQNLRASRKFAEREYGKELLATVHDWAAAKCDADPAFNQQMRSSDDPYEAAMQAYNREQVLEKVKPEDLTDLDAFRAWRAEQAARQTPEPADAAPIPRSLATASGSGAAGKPHVNVGPGEAFASIIPS